MSERIYEVETYESTPGNVVRFAIVDTATGHWLCNCPCIEDADKIAAALNAAEQAARERELLAKMAELIRVVLENSYWHSDKYAAGRELLAEYAALQTTNNPKE